MKITLDYDEYLKLVEQVNLSKNKINKKVEEIRNQLLKNMNRDLKNYEEQLKDEYNVKLRKNLIKSIKFAMSKRVNLLGYVKLKDINIYLEELL